MSAPLLQRLADGPGDVTTTELRVRIFRLICALAAVLSLGVIAPLNAVQHLPWVVHVSNLTLGLLGAFCYWQSRAGRHFITLFFILLILLLDAVWFWNAGSDGSVTHFFYPVMLFVIALFTGWSRWALAVGVWLNVGLLFILEHFYPAWVTPFHGREDRLLDIETGVMCSFAALAAVTWFILINYNREHRRVTEIAAELRASEANYREIFNSTSDALFVHTPDGRILDVNDQTCALFGETRAHMIGRRVGDYSLGESPYRQQEATAKAMEVLQGQPQLFEWRSRRSTGELFWSEVALRAWGAKGEPRLVASVRDISSRKLAQE